MKYTPVFINKKAVFLLVFMCLPFLVFSQTGSDSVVRSIVKSSRFDGVLKAKVETSTDAGVLRFNVRNARVGVRGEIGARLSYRLQVELSGEGVFQPLDLFGTLHLAKNFSFQFGQQFIPFENNYIISPAESMFANRAFLGKYFTPGTRDIGAMAQYRFHIGGFPMEGQAGMFNGGRINNPQWTSRPSFAFRLIAGKMDGFRTTAKIYRYYRELNDNSDALDLLLWGADLHYDKNGMRVEAELMNRHSYITGLDLLGTYVQGAYTFSLPNANLFHCLTPTARWDAMGYDLKKEGFDVQRITVGINFGLTFIPFDSVFRINYENYFLRKDVDFPDFHDRDPHVADNKLTLELVVRF